MRIVMTGASGNVGTAVLQNLGDAHEVVAVVRRPPEQRPDPYQRADWVALDLAAPDAADRLGEAMSGADAVVHLAWEFQPSHDRAQLRRVGVEGSRAVVRAVQRAGVPHLVHMSSLGAYSPAPGRRVDESWPTNGISTLPYSRHKARVERMLDELEAGRPEPTAGPVVTRLRPGLVLQRAAGSALARYGLPAVVPTAVLRHVPVLPLDRTFVVPVVHTDDVANALVRVLEQRAGGAFNLAAEPPVTRQMVAEALGAQPVHVPGAVMRAAVSTTWHLHLQPVEPGWLDLALTVPLLDTTRARQVLGWEPQHDAQAVLDEAVAGLSDAAAAPSPVLRPRSVLEGVGRAVRRAPVARRPRP